MYLYEIFLLMKIYPNWLNGKYFVKGKPPKMSEYLRNKCFVKGKSPKNVWIPQK
jgi:hypothetical protein